MTSQSKIYEPRLRVLFDVLITLNALLAVIFAFHSDWFRILWPYGLLVNFFMMMFWALWVVPVFRICISDSEVSGPSRGLKRVRLARQDLKRGEMRKTGGREPWFGYRQIASSKGENIRLYYRLLGRRQVHKIMKEVFPRDPGDESLLQGRYPSYVR